jgi:hypothetical protein
VTLSYLLSGMGVQQAVPLQALDPGAVLDGVLLPPGLDQLAGPAAAVLDWVYRDGYTQAAACHREGGWAGLERAMRSRRSSRDLLHPDRAPLHPEAIPDPGVDLPKSYTVVDRDVLGELGIVVLVSTWTGKDNLGLLSGDGWSGDLLLRWERPGGENGVTMWVTRWVSPEEAKEFQYGYLRGLEARFTGIAPRDLGAGSVLYAGRDRVLTVSARDREVRIEVRPAESAGLPRP